MKVSIHQPQYLPWVPYLLKIAESDVFVALDSVDFQKNGLQNRNQIKTAQGATWLTVPVRQKLGQKIVDVEINPSENWRKKHWATVLQNYSKSKYFRGYGDELEAAYDIEWDRLVDLNLHLLDMMLRWMDIPVKVLRSSQMKAGGKASELVLNLCREVGATHYLSGIGGMNYLDEQAFHAAGVELVYRPPILPEVYEQQFPAVGFLGDVSAIDMIFNCGRDWRNFLKALA